MVNSDVCVQWNNAVLEPVRAGPRDVLLTLSHSVLTRTGVAPRHRNVSGTAGMLDNPTETCVDVHTLGNSCRSAHS